MIGETRVRAYVRMCVRACVRASELGPDILTFVCDYVRATGDMK